MYTANNIQIVCKERIMKNRNRIVWSSTDNKPPLQPKTSNAVEAYEKAINRSRLCEGTYKYYLSVGNPVKMREWHAKSQYWYERAQQIRPLVRLREAESNAASCAQSLIDIDKLIKYSVSSDVSALLSQKKAIQRSHEEYIDFVAKLHQGFSSDRIQKMQDLVKKLIIDLKNTK